MHYTNVLYVVYFNRCKKKPRRIVLSDVLCSFSASETSFVTFWWYIIKSGPDIRHSHSLLIPPLCARFRTTICSTCCSIKAHSVFVLSSHFDAREFNIFISVASNAWLLTQNTDSPPFPIKQSNSQMLTICHYGLHLSIAHFKIVLLLSISTSFHIGILFGYLYLWLERSVGASSDRVFRLIVCLSVCLSVRPCLSVIASRLQSAIFRILVVIQ